MASSVITPVMPSKKKSRVTADETPKRQRLLIDADDVEILRRALEIRQAKLTLSERRKVPIYEIAANIIREALSKEVATAKAEEREKAEAKD